MSDIYVLVDEHGQVITTGPYGRRKPAAYSSERNARLGTHQHWRAKFIVRLNPAMQPEWEAV